MIRINLLPVRAARKRAMEIRQVAIFCSTLLLLIIIISSMYIFERIRINRTRSEIADARIKIAELDKKIGKLNEIKQLQAQVKKKLDILAQLRKNKTGPASRLATLGDVTPDQLWLTSYAEKEREVKIAGVAFSEELLAAFMMKLEASKDFAGVELLISEQTELAGKKLKRFELTCKLEQHPEMIEKKTPQ